MSSNPQSKSVYNGSHAEVVARRPLRAGTFVVAEALGYDLAGTLMSLAAEGTCHTRASPPILPS
jgi:hypothetical protein